MSIRTISTRLKIDGEKEYTIALKNVSLNITALKSEMNLLAAEFAGKLNSYEALTKKGEILEKQLSQQKEREKQTALAVAEATEALNEQSTALENLKQRRDAELKSTGEQSKEYKELEKDLKKVEENVQRAANSVRHWETQNNNAKAGVAELATEINKNNKHLDETGRMAGGAATSINEYGKEITRASEGSKQFGEVSKMAIGTLAGALSAAGIQEKAKEIADALRECVDAAQEFEKSSSRLTAMTGAVGADLDGMKQSIMTIYTSLPYSLEEISGTMGILSTMTGLTGKELESLTEKTLNYARVNDESAEAAATALGRLMNDTKQNAAEMSVTMDMLTKASQMTGIGVNALSEHIIATGPAFVEMGFSIEKSIALFSSFYKSGAEPRELISSLNIVLNRMAKDGATNAEEAFNTLLQSIKDAPDILSATTIASEAFGARVGAKVADDIRAGRFEIEEFTNAISESGGTLDKMAAATLTSADRLQTLKNASNTLKIAIGEQLSPALEKAAKAGSGLNEWAAELIRQNEWIVPVVSALCAGIAALTVIITVYTLNITALAAAKAAATKAIVAFSAALASNPFGATAVALTTLVVAIGTFIAMTGTASESQQIYNERIEASRESLERLQTAHRDTEDSIHGASKVAEQYIKRLEELEAAGLDTAESQAEYARLIDLLNETIPSLNIVINEKTGLIEGGTRALWENTEAWRENAIAQAAAAASKELLSEATNAAIEEEMALRRLTAEQAKYTDELKKLEELKELRKNRNPGYTTDYEGVLLNEKITQLEKEVQTVLTLEAAYNAAADATKEATAAYEEHFDIVRNIIGATNELVSAETILAAAATKRQEGYRMISEGLASSGLALIKEADNLEKQAAAMTAEIKRNADTAEELRISHEELLSTSKELYSEINILSSAFKEQADSGELSFETILKLIDAGYASAIAIDKQTGAVYINEEAYRALIGAKLEDQRVTMQSEANALKAQAMRLEREAAANLQEGYEELSKARIADAAAAMAEATGIEAALAAMEKAASHAPYSAKSGRTSGSDQDAQREAQKAAEEYEKQMQKAVISVQNGYMLMSEAASVFGVNQTELAQRYSIETTYSKQMDKAVQAVISGHETIYSAMQKYGVEYDEFVKRLESYTGDMRKQYDIQRDVIDYHYKLGKLSSQEYYDDLTRMRDTYLEENTQAWRSATLELKKLKEDMERDSIASIKAASDNAIDELKAQLERKKALIKEELSLEKQRLNSIITMINEEIQARRNLRDDEGAEDKIAEAQKRVQDAERSLAAARSQMEYARDDAARLEAEKLVLQRQSAVEEANAALLRAHQDYEDQLWYREKQAEIDAVRNQIAAAETKAAALEEKAKAETAKAIAEAAAEAARQQQALQEQMNAAISAIAATVASPSSSAANSTVNNTASIQVTYTNAAATSSQIAAALQKVLYSM
ncbi:MAG: phage tail tape measure protein [Oscillospiraceae bacterium]|nr:phage tail tape measure protein [Oscillospiraceae bacterium]